MEHAEAPVGSPLRGSAARAGLALLLLAAACGHDAPASRAAADLVLLAERLDEATVTSAAAPEAARASRSWRFDQPQPDWHVATSGGRQQAAVTTEAQADSLRMTLAAPGGGASGMLTGGLALELDGGPLNDWAGAVVRLRSHDRLSGVAVACNVDDPDSLPERWSFFSGEAGMAPVFNDGSIQDYSLPLRGGKPGDELRSVALFVGAPSVPAALDVLAITLVPRGADFLDATGVRAVTRGGETRHTLFAHAPARLAWRLTVPEGGRLDVGLSCLPGDALTCRVAARRGDGEPRVLAEDALVDAVAWLQRSVDLSEFAGSEIELLLEAEGRAPGAVALWGAPVLSGSARATRPNVIFYVIDGGGASQMSLYGYDRPTTPYFEELAAEGVVFERAHSNSTWTQPSTASFMTSLQHSVLGGLRRGVHSTPVPRDAVTFAEHMHRGGWQTAVFSSNPNAGRVIGLQRGVDVMVDDAEPDGPSSTSSDLLHELFSRWRDDYPGAPFWVHFQTIDVHEPNEPLAPYAGRFVPPELRAQADEWEGRMWQAGGHLFGTTSIAAFYDEALELAGVERHAFYDARRGLYDETMAHQDSGLRALVEQLKSSGEWENTLLVIGADHGHPAGTFSRWGRGLIEPKPEEWQGALFDAYASRVPLLFVWPARIAGGRRVAEPVSMIDVLPTVLELCGLPPAEVAQGRSLAPLLLGRPEKLPPVILDEVRVDEASGELLGNIEIVDGTWGASLEVGPQPPGSDPARGRHTVPAGGRWGAVHPWFPDPPRLLLYDLERDPFATHAVNDEHPELRGALPPASRGALGGAPRAGAALHRGRRRGAVARAARATQGAGIHPLTRGAAHGTTAPASRTRTRPARAGWAGSGTDARSARRASQGTPAARVGARLPAPAAACRLAAPGGPTMLPPSMRAVLLAGAVAAAAAAQGAPGEVVALQKLSSTSGGFPGPLDDVDAFSRAVVPLGDLDGDGAGDLAVGAIGDDDGGVERGAVWILFLQPDGTVRSQAKISATAGGFSGTLDAGDWFGFSGAALGDLDGDGTGDLAIGAPRDDDGVANAGAVWILFLAPDGSVTSHTRIGATSGGFAGPLLPNDQFGTSLAALGDLDGDGTGELAVGAVHDSDGGADQGAVWILFLKPDGTVKAQSKISETSGGFPGALDGGDQFAIGLGVLHDMNGDGLPELAVGARADDDGGTDRGAVWLLFLAADGSVSSHTKISASSGGFAGPLDDGDFFGVSVASPGDLDGDGHVDLLVGANLDDDGGTDRGAVWALFLDAGGDVLSHAKISATSGGFTGTLDLLDDFGIALAMLGDHDGDGTADAAVGALWDDDGGVDRGAVWVLFLDAGKWIDAGGALAGSAGTPVLAGAGTLVGGAPVALTLAGAPPGAAVHLVIGFAELGAPFKGGTLVPQPALILGGLAANGAGSLQLAAAWPAGLPTDFPTWFQCWIADAGGPSGFSASNGLLAVTP